MPWLEDAPPPGFPRATAQPEAHVLPAGCSAQPPLHPFAPVLVRRLDCAVRESGNADDAGRATPQSRALGRLATDYGRAHSTHGT